MENLVMVHVDKTINHSFNISSIVFPAEEGKPPERYKLLYDIYLSSGSRDSEKLYVEVSVGNGSIWDLWASVCGYGANEVTELRLCPNRSLVRRLTEPEVRKAVLEGLPKEEASLVQRAYNFEANWGKTK